MPDLVIFDCDGVLIDSEPLAIKAAAMVFQAHGVQTDEDDIRKQYTGVSQKFMLSDLERRFCMIFPATINNDLDEQGRQLFTSELKAIAGVAEILDAVPCKFCIASSSSHEQLKLTLTHVGLYDHFGTNIFSAEQVKHGKPAPDLFLFAARKMNVTPTRCLVIEDSRFGVQAAKAAGMEAWGFCGGGHCEPDHGINLMAEGASQVFMHMRDVQNCFEK